jgi:hypothetical protein
LRSLAAQLLPPPLASIDLSERLGIDLSSLRTVEDFRRLLSTVLAAVARGGIAPVEAARIVRRARGPAARRLAPRTRNARELWRKPEVTRREG